MPDLNMDRVAELVQAKGVSAYVEQTGGGCATIFAGPTFTEEGYGTRYAAAAGPGTFGAYDGGAAAASMGHTDEFCVGADDYGDGPNKYVSDQPVPTEQDDAEAFVAQMIVDRVVEYAAEKMAAMITADVESGVLPPVSEWQTVSGLQGVTDANVAYIAEALPVPDGEVGQPYLDVVNAACDKVNAHFAAVTA